jgi:dTDP-4-amino-4,6-dideoxyglucose formyltransferase
MIDQSRSEIARTAAPKSLILTDNVHALDLGRELRFRFGNVEVFQSPSGTLPGVPRLDVKTSEQWILEHFTLVWSIHCKQYFPPGLVRGVRCINVHPGLNPINRGWYPQVFSILDGTPAGVTIHEIDEKLDHGPIIVQQEVAVHPWDTSGSVYARLMQVERALVMANFEAIRDGTCLSRPPTDEGNLHRRADFDKLLHLDLQRTATMGELLDLLRALTHDGYRNAHFIAVDGSKVFVSVKLDREEPKTDQESDTP